LFGNSSINGSDQIILACHFRVSKLTCEKYGDFGTFVGVKNQCLRKKSGKLTMENKPHTSFGPPKGGLEREIIYFRDTKVGEILEFGLMSYHFKHI